MRERGRGVTSSLSIITGGWAHKSIFVNYAGRPGVCVPVRVCVPVQKG